MKKLTLLLTLFVLSLISACNAVNTASRLIALIAIATIVLGLTYKDIILRKLKVNFFMYNRHMQNKKD